MTESLVQKVFRFGSAEKKSSEMVYRIKSGNRAGCVVIGEPRVQPGVVSGGKNLYCFYFMYNGGISSGALFGKNITDIFDYVPKN